VIKNNEIAETTSQRALKKVQVHEAECAIRYEYITARLDEGSAKFKRLELMLWGVYPFILGSVALSRWM
jgi:hypothetical protein|tara:strand:- start:143 stop:349 length:207 start_codon:yes stop_codon:yes gene_type:complete